MNILHISTSDTGGAGKACLRLHQALLQENVNSQVLVLFKYLNEQSTVRQFFEYQNPNILKRIYNFSKIAYYPVYNRLKLSDRAKEFEMFSQPRTLIDITEHPDYERADIIHLHWIAHFIDWKSFFGRNKKPVIWTLHDSNPFTGGCHLHFDCRKFTEDCRNCPQLSGTLDKSYALKNLSYKKVILSSVNNLNIVTPSEWLGKESEASKLFSKYTHSVINNGIDYQAFKPMNKTEVRKILSLPQDKKIILFIANEINKPYKGFMLLLDAIEKIKNSDNIILCSIGKNSINTKQDVKIINLGFVGNEEKMASAYSAADVFVNPSLSENFPTTVIESIICGTPVIGFPIGGIKEIIEDGKNGILCKETSSNALAQAINLFFNGEIKFDSESIRELAISKYDLKIQTSKYIKLYKEISSNQNKY